MARPLPASDADRFDIVSLSLVLNFVPDAVARGDMLRRTRAFLRPAGLVYLVLPLPCVANSRYCSHDHLIGLMAALGYSVVSRKDSKKLAFFLFSLGGEAARQNVPFPKRILSDGARRNNFCIVLS